MSEILNEALKKYEEVQELKKKLAAELGDVLKTAIVEKCNEYDMKVSIRWHQYTPYFNDGDACEFYVNEFQYRFNEETVGGDYEDGYRDLFSLKYDNMHDNLIRIAQEINDFMCKIPTDIFKEAFGDHATVTIHEHGVDVTDCEHD